MTTPRDIIKSSLQLLSIIDPIESVDNDEASGLFDRLNRMLASISNQSFVIHADTQVSKVLTAGTGSYTIGSGGDINTTRPLRIKAAWYDETSSGQALSYPLEYIDETQFANISLKTLQTTLPRYYSYDGGNPLGTIKIYPVPSSAITLYLELSVALTAFTGLTQTIALPPGYEEMLEYNFAMRIAPMYQKAATPEIIKIARDSLAGIKRTNLSYDNMEAEFSSALPRSRGGRYQIESDTNR